MIFPVILCGGSGTRLWPVSRKSYPKQFSKLIGAQSLFQMTVQRMSGKEFEPPVILTNDDFRFIVKEQLSEIGVGPSSIIIEPSALNTAPAIMAAAYSIALEDQEALMLITPSDHFIPDQIAFLEAMKIGGGLAQSGKIITFGLKPTHPETGYGYLECNSVDGAPCPLERFVEKPNSDDALKMTESGHYLWNAGIFMAKASVIIKAFDRYAKEIHDGVIQAYNTGKCDLDFYRLKASDWDAIEGESIDYAVMEKAEDLIVVPFQSEWSDVGDWNAVGNLMGCMENAIGGSSNVTEIDCQNTTLRSEDNKLQLVGIGLEDIVAVAMPDAVLISNKSRTQDVKFVVDELKKKGANQAEKFPVEHRPWGWFESLIVGDRFQVKKITVKPGGVLSLQSHHHRSEHWIVVEGTAKVTVGDDVKLVTENQSVYVPLGATHRMENQGKIPMVVIEVQTGRYLGEDDIVRYEDAYSRS